MRRFLALMTGTAALLTLPSCGGPNKGSAPSGYNNRVLVSQGVQSPSTQPGLVIINGYNDTLPRLPRIGAGTSPGLMAISPNSRNIVAAFDAGSNSVYAASTSTEADMGHVQLSGPTASMVIPTSSPVGYAAVPSAHIAGFSLLGAVEVMNLSAGGLTTTIAVSQAQTVVSNSTGSQLLVFSNDSNSVVVLSPALAVSPVDFSCYPNLNPNPPTNPPVCTTVPGFDRPVNAVINGTTAYVLNCGAECGGTQASIQTLDLNSLAVGPPIPVNGATDAFLSGNNLYVAGNGTPTGPLCASLTNSINAKTAATYCGTLDIIDISTLTDPYFNNPAAEIAIPDGYHDRMDMSINGQLFVGSYDCTNIGDVNNPVGEVRGCLAILNTNTGAMVIPPDNGDVDGLQSFTTRDVEYVAEGGNLRVYDTLTNQLLINVDYLPLGTIPVIGYVGDVKAIDFF